MDVFVFKFRRGTAAEWSAANPILAEAEPGVELDTKRFKLGDGVSHWATLPYYLSEDSIATYIDQALDAAGPLGPEQLDLVADKVMADLELPDLVLYYNNTKA